ncbi:MAG: hypothetical protein KDK39_14630 [Leptospiraceae bacterium]|nr:hypothetical protein [Leptospiraceae bacterium]
MATHPFSEQDQIQIKNAVAEAEKSTSGEIVPYYVERSDDYQEGIWRGAILTTLLGIGLAATQSNYFGAWQSLGLFEILALIGLSMLVGVGLSFIPFFRRLFAGSDLISRRTAARALEAFVSEEVFDTRDRTGILLFMSGYERRVHVIGDSGINSKVEQSDWDEVVSLIRQGMQSGTPAAGLVKAIQKCGQLLERKGVEIKADDTNELADGLRIGEN